VISAQLPGLTGLAGRGASLRRARSASTLSHARHCALHWQATACSGAGFRSVKSRVRRHAGTYRRTWTSCVRTYGGYVHYSFYLRNTNPKCHAMPMPCIHVALALKLHTYIRKCTHARTHTYDDHPPFEPPLPPPTTTTGSLQQGPPNPRWPR
jgi:hypothetical protein